jgi:hypothetical protein
MLDVAATPVTAITAANAVFRNFFIVWLLVLGKRHYWRMLHECNLNAKPPREFG